MIQVNLKLEIIEVLIKLYLNIFIWDIIIIFSKSNINNNDNDYNNNNINEGFQQKKKNDNESILPMLFPYIKEKDFQMKSFNHEKS